MMCEQTFEEQLRIEHNSRLNKTDANGQTCMFLR